MNELLISGFVSRDFAWSFKTKSKKDVSQFRLCDNYLRFYLKCILPNLDRIDRDAYRTRSLLTIPGWHSILGLQFQNLVLKNRELIWSHLNINPDDIVNDNPFLQRETQNQKGCQIDYLIQTRLNSLYLGEIKFSQNTLGMEVVHSVQEKIKRLRKPRGFSCNPVLICIGEVTQPVLDSEFFTHIIHLSDVIES